jgi:hypothetical protein
MAVQPVNRIRAGQLPGVRPGGPDDVKEQIMPSQKPSIVFAHGLWADGSCFSQPAAADSQDRQRP